MRSRSQQRTQTRFSSQQSLYDGDDSDDKRHPCNLNDHVPNTTTRARKISLLPIQAFHSECFLDSFVTTISLSTCRRRTSSSSRHHRGGSSPEVCTDHGHKRLLMQSTANTYTQTRTKRTTFVATLDRIIHTVPATVPRGTAHTQR